MAFISSIVLGLTKSGLFFHNEPLIENIRSWVSTMSSATNRPLRHTATVAALAFQSGLAEYGRELVETSAIQLRQTQAEKKRGKTVNRARLIEMENQVKVNARNQEVVRTELNDWFDAVFIHRYRDVDHHIRLECMQALGDFVMIYPELFFEGQYTRYFGWLMSDINAQTRMETTKSLMRIYRDHDKLSGMRAFTERFRERMVEMATRDSDPGVRATVIEMLDTIRGAGFLEPSDIDLLGRLIFDSEPRVRKAVVKFFVDNVNDSYDSRLEELGGKEATDELFKNHDDVNENYDTPRVEWLRLKVLIETLTAYDAEDELETDGMVAVPESNSYMIVPGLQSRFALAAEELCEKIPDLQWEILAGYVLFDHSGTATQNGSRSRNSSAQLLGRFKAEVKLTEKEEVLLLEVLNSAVKLSLKQSQELLNDKSRKLTKAQRLVEQEEFDGKARHLTNLIPRLLSKFGALPEAASAILRLEHVLSPENQDASAYSSLLNDIKKQFQTHVKPRVLEEASLALLNARSGEAEEVAQNHLHALAEDSSRKLSILAKGQDLSVRGDLDDDTLDILEGAAIRLEMLGRIEDICDLLETPPSEPRKRVSTLPAPVDILLMILNRGLVDDSSDPGGREDEIVLHAARALGFYFMWKVRALQNQIRTSGRVSPTTITSLSSRKEDFIATVTSVLQQRSGADDLRVFLAGALIDLHVGFASLVRVKPPTKRATEDAAAPPEDRRYLALVTEIPKVTQTAFLQILSACERAFAKRTKRSLERNPEEQKPQDDNAEPATDDEPEEDDDQDDDQDDDMDLDDPNASADSKLAATLFSEQRLCEFAGKLVLGIWADVVDGKSEVGSSKMVRRRLKRNRTRLGPNFKGIVDALEKGAGAGKGAAKKGAKAPVKPTTAGAAASVRAVAGNANPGRNANDAVVESEEEEEDDEEMEEAD
jgi:cohesin complex subunit SA-1/2